MEFTILKWGNSAAVRLPANLLKQMKVRLGDKLRADLRPDGVLLRPAHKVYALADLMAQCDLDAPPPKLDVSV